MFDGEYLKDIKFPNRKFLVDNEIMIYDSNTNVFNVINDKEINLYISTLKKNNRHWVQLQNNRFINNMISKYFHNLNYLF